MAARHDHHHGVAGAKLRTAVLLTALILVVELAGGIASHSLALLSDAGHVLTDIAALGLAWFATAQAERPANARKTYGYHRTGILAALVNAVTLIMVVVAIAFEAVRRLQHPEAVTPWMMFVSAAVAIVVNLYIGLGLRKEGGDNLNVRAAMLHVFGDVGASAAVIAGGLVILLTGWYPADALISLCIAVLIARGAWAILRDTVDILMEATPRDLDVAQLVRDIVRQPGVADVHDLHVWSIAGGMRALSAHVRIADRPLSACDGLLVDLNRLLQDRYKIGHSTLQLECAGCDPNHLYCTLNSDGGMEHAHAHRNHHHNHAETGDGLHVHR
jgi:cobalt-zinc-cadmium efflux system protein